MFTRPSVLPESRHVGMFGWKLIWGICQMPADGTWWIFDGRRIWDKMERRTSVTSSLWLSTYCRIGELVDLESLRQSSALKVTRGGFT